MNQKNEAPRAAANGVRGGFQNGSPSEYAEVRSAPRVSDNLREVALALRTQSSDLRTWTIEKAARLAREELRALEGQRLLLDRQAVALEGFLAQLRRVPEGVRYIGDVGVRGPR